MRKFFLALFFAVLMICMPFLAACDTEELGSLEDLSRPYAGEYQCEILEYGGENKLRDYEYIRLDLSYGGEFTLLYKQKEGSGGSVGGTYEVDTRKGQITFHAQNGVRKVSRTFPYENGAVRIQLNLLGKLLYAEFEM